MHVLQIYMGYNTIASCIDSKIREINDWFIKYNLDNFFPCFEINLVSIINIFSAVIWQEK